MKKLLIILIACLSVNVMAKSCKTLIDTDTFVRFSYKAKWAACEITAYKDGSKTIDECSFADDDYTTKETTIETIWGYKVISERFYNNGKYEKTEYNTKRSPIEKWSSWLNSCN